MPLQHLEEGTILMKDVTREVVVKQFFLDFIENLGDDYKRDEELDSSAIEEAELILTSAR